jgi:AcrR family transcriptional regulator
MSTGVKKEMRVQRAVKGRSAPPTVGSIRSRRDTQFPEKREALLNAAAKLFREKGYEGASLNDLADMLHITKPTLYYYVKSKDQLVLEVIRRAQNELLRSMHEIEVGGGTAYDKLRKVMINYVSTMVSDYGACLVLLNSRHLEEQTHDEVAGRIAEGDEIIYRIFNSGQKDGSLRVGDRVITVHALFGSLNWLPRWHKSDGRLSPEKFARVYVDILLEGVRPRDARSAAGRPKRASNSSIVSNRET